MILGPYIPPENYGPPPAPPPHPVQPGMLLLTVALIVLVVFIARELALRRSSERIVDELTIRWLPAEALDMMAEADAEELTFGPDD